MPKQNVPALRLEGFSGEWEDCTLGGHSHVTTGSSDVQDADPDGLYPFFVRSQHVERSNKYLFDGEAILIPGEGRLGEIFHYYIGKFDFHQRVYRISDFEDIDGKYVYWAMQHSFKDYAMQNTVKATVDSLRQPTITGFIFQKPPTLEEQQAIGAIFTNLDAAINQHTLKHKSLQQAKTALMQRMFPQEGQTVPELRLEGFDGEWEKTTLGELGTFRSGVGFPEREQGGTVGLPFYKVSDLSARGNELLLQSANHYVTEGQIVYNHWAPVTALPAILFAKVGAAVFLGRKRLVNNAFLLDNNLMAFSLNTESWDVQFADAYLKTVDLTQFTQSGALPSLNARHLAEAEATIPPTLEEQQAIGALFTNLDQLIAAEAQYITSLKQAKTALLQRMFI